MTTADQLHAEGYARGVALGRAKALLQLVTHKSGWPPSHIIDTVFNADQEQMSAWLGRILTAKTMKDMSGD
ncbi:hypothetical protein DFR70_108287 [Nocardia tenerifensis]|uniref:Uncharacterized protein n=1 Tax=Nocardia tenerifensis TaxID=228006 RepID=A0A318JY83_9NOCA|nr:hypothetical protein [Nocardia tenerifensis]PXX61729.1 hypothetical protein DFR70_108287 [Nocardia tenerifensis]